MVARIAALFFVLALSLLSTATANNQWDHEIQQLESRLQKYPGDLDIQLQLALRLSWKGDLDRAYQLGREVVTRAPEYRDAVLLLARIEGWRGQYDRARERLTTLLNSSADRETRLALADVELWSQNGEAAELVLAPLAAETDNDADLLYRLALAAMQQKRIWKARRIADRAIDLDNNHERAKRLRDEIVRLRGDLSTDYEFIDSVDPSVRQAYGITATGTGYIDSKLTVTGQYEYRFRFNTHNHRFAARSDWRFAKKWAAIGYLRTGVVEVVPTWTAQAAVEYVPRGYAFRIQYQFDKLPWPGQLHRLRFAADVGINDNIFAIGAIDTGILKNCSDYQPARTLHAGGRYQGRLGYIQGTYSYGVELERPPLPGFVEGQFGNNVCDPAIAVQFPGLNLALVDTSVHQGALVGIWKLRKRLFVRLGYSIQIRGEAGQVHGVVIGANISY